MKRLEFTFLTVAVLSLLCSPAPLLADWQKMNPPPDVDKANLNHQSCWLATASNMLAGAGYGDGLTVQARANDIYAELVAHFGTVNGGWADTALTWWLGSANNTWPNNPYDVVTVYGNKEKVPWADSNGAQFAGNELRRCQFLGLSISWPRTTQNGDPYGGHAITCWGDSGDANNLSGSPEQVIVTDSDRDTDGNVQTYTYDDYTNPNPAGYDEGHGWYVNYSNNHPFIKHIITLCPTDNPGDNVLTQKVVGSYKIHQDNQTVSATDLHYKVGTDVDILSYKTSIDWDTNHPPSITQDANIPRNLTVNWDLTDNPVPYCTWITITTEFVLPYWNSISYDDVYFTYPLGTGRLFPTFRWEIYTYPVSNPDVCNITGGYVVGSFDLIDNFAPGGPTVVGEYRFMHEYDYMQNPEYHSFYLQEIDPSTGYYVSNIRFGHTYSFFDAEQLWAFDNWMTYSPTMQPLSAGVNMTLDWTGRLPYPQGENYRGEFQPPPCTVVLPQDFNRDCKVDFKDFDLFADRWLESTAL